MIDTKSRLERSAAVLRIIDFRRKKTGDPQLGSGIERYILNRELQEIEEEILANPGPLEALLVRVRR